MVTLRIQVHTRRGGLLKKWLRKKAKRQGVMHFGDVRVHESDRREDFPLFNIVDGEQHSIGFQPNCNVGGHLPISDSVQQMRRIGDHG